MRGAPTAILVGVFMAGSVAGGGTMMMRAGHAEDSATARIEGAMPRDDFDALMAQSMERMHAGMAVQPSGDPDRDFAAMMIPHHQGAVDMAKAELAYGRDPILRRLAQGIIVEQRQEIEIMHRALAERLQPSVTTTAPQTAHHH